MGWTNVYHMGPILYWHDELVMRAPSGPHRQNYVGNLWECYICTFCIACALFAKHRIGLGALVNKPFRSWHKKAATVKDHCDLDYHVAAVLDASNLMHRF